MALQGKPTPERGFANFLTGVLDGYVKGRGLDMANKQEQRSQESAMMEQKMNALQMRMKEAELREFEATENLRRQLTESEIAKNKATTSDELLELKRAIAQANADKAVAQAELASVNADIARERTGLKDLMNKIAGFGPSGGAFQGQSFQMEGDEIDTRDMPAIEPGATGPSSFLPPPTSQSPGYVPGGPGMALGGKRVLTGPPREGNVMEQEDTFDRMLPGDVAGSILPPGVEPKMKPRTFPIQQGEVDAAIKSDNAEKALLDVLGIQPFGAAMETKKQTNPIEYQKDMQAEIERHEKQYPGPYKAYRAAKLGQSMLSERMLKILNDPDERAWQNTSDTDAVASQAVAELSLEALIDPANSANPLYQYLGQDRASKGTTARYSGKLLNLAMRDVFGAEAQDLAFSDDLDYTLRQVVEALYSDQMAADGNAKIGFTNPLSVVKRIDHPIMQILDAYWEPVRAMDRASRKREERFPGQYRNPMLGRPGRE